MRGVVSGASGPGLLSWPKPSARAGLEITADVWDALGWVLGDSPTSPEPVVLLATYLDALAKGYGLSESQMIAEDPLERAAPPAPALPLLRHYLAEGGADLDADRLRDRLHAVFAVLADRPVARKTLNRTRPLTEVELLTAGPAQSPMPAGPAASRTTPTSRQQAGPGTSRP